MQTTENNLGTNTNKLWDVHALIEVVETAIYESAAPDSDTGKEDNFVRVLRVARKELTDIIESIDEIDTHGKIISRK